MPYARSVPIAGILGGRRVGRRARLGAGPALATGDLVLTPAEPADVTAWDALLDRPPAEGLAASSLGGAAHTPRQWVRRLRAVRDEGGRAYLVRVGGQLVGEVLVFLDPANALAELVIWLSEPWAGRLGDVADLLSRQLLDDATARRVLITVSGAADAATLAGLGFVQEGRFSDPPFPDRYPFRRLG